MKKFIFTYNIMGLFALLALLAIPHELDAQRFRHAAPSRGAGGGFQHPPSRASHTTSRPTTRQASRPTTRPSTNHTTNRSINGGHKVSTSRDIPKRNTNTREINRNTNTNNRNTNNNRVTDRSRDNNRNNIGNNVNVGNRNNVNINVDRHREVNVRNTRVRPPYRPYVRPPYVYGGFHFYAFNPYFYHPYRPFYWGPVWHPWGFFVASLATTAIIISVENQKYHYDEGNYYVEDKDGYTVVQAPVGATIKVLPDGYETVQAEGSTTNNYYYGGAFYTKSDEGYTVVPATAGTIVPHLPEGGEETKVGDQTYVKFGDTYYQPIQVDGKDMYEIVEVKEE